MPVTLLDLLSNTLILHQTVPYMSAAALLSLGATSKSLRHLLYGTPYVFRYLDLSRLRSVFRHLTLLETANAAWGDPHRRTHDLSLTEDEFYSAPIRDVFTELTKTNVLRDVQTLILDGLDVTSELIGDIIGRETFNVRILSIREVKHLNERKLMQTLLYAVRPSRPEGTPKLKGLYIFGKKNNEPLDSYKSVENLRDKSCHQPIGVMSLEGAQLGVECSEVLQSFVPNVITREPWYESSGRMNIRRTPLEERAWADTVRACLGLISFDAVLCEGPRHTGEDGVNGMNPFVAEVALGPRGCEVCHTLPEGPAFYGVSPAERFPLLAPPPLHSSAVRTAKRPRVSILDSPPALLVRCLECLRDRWCERCGRWWCEDCYTGISAHKRTFLQRKEFEEDLKVARSASKGQDKPHIKVHIGLCVENCLVGEMMIGAGSNG
ncbi:MAG: hypothetical protein M1835_005252 [Candelina submexicana]|nr:MAG: hypothetical protein M1835_005252 [Candelina submexicana]